MVVSFACGLVGCAATAREDPLAAVPDSPNAAVIRELIGKLAISDEKASPDPIYTPSQDTPKTDKRVIAYDAAKQIYALPRDYRGSFFRKGADGRRHERPVFSNDLITCSNVKAWLAEREGRTLPELQLEALGWVRAEEERIGAATPEDEKRFLAPLRARYAEIQEQVAAAAKQRVTRTNGEVGTRCHEQR